MSRARTFPATVDHEGVIQFDPVLRRAFRRHVLELSGEAVEVTVKKRHPSRSVQQNRWYWGVILAHLADYTGFTAEEVHEYLKARFLPEILGEVPARRRLEIVDKRDGAVVDAREIDVELSTATLNTEQFSRFADGVRDWAARDLGVYIPGPDEDLRVS